MREEARGWVWPGWLGLDGLDPLGGGGWLRHTFPPYQLEFLRLNQWLPHLDLCFVLDFLLDGISCLKWQLSIRERYWFDFLINNRDLNFYFHYSWSPKVVYSEGWTWKICSCFHIKPIGVKCSFIIYQQAYHKINNQYTLGHIFYSNNTLLHKNHTHDKTKFIPFYLFIMFIYCLFLFIY